MPFQIHRDTTHFLTFVALLGAGIALAIAGGPALLPVGVGLIGSASTMAGRSKRAEP